MFNGDGGIMALIFLSCFGYNKMATEKARGGVMVMRWQPLVSATVMTGVCVFLLTGHALQEEYMVFLLVGLCVALF